MLLKEVMSVALVLLKNHVFNVASSKPIFNRPGVMLKIYNNKGTFFPQQMNHRTGQSYIIDNLPLCYNIEKYSSLQISSVPCKLFHTKMQQVLHFLTQFTEEIKTLLPIYIQFPHNQRCGSRTCQIQTYLSNPEANTRI